MVRLVALPQTLEDVHGLFLAGLLDLDGLEAALKGGVSLDVLAELVLGGRADALEFAARQCWLHDVRGVDRAFGGARAHQRVQLVDEQDHVAVGASDLFHDLFHALFEFATVFGARHQAGEVERDQALVFEQVRDVAAHDAQGEALGDGGFADAGLADEARVVLGAAAEDLHDALDLLLAADHGVQLAFAGELRQVAAEFVERLRLGRARSGVGGRACAGLGLRIGVLQRHDLLACAFEVHAELGQHASGQSVAFANEAEEQVLGADVVVVEVAGLVVGQVDDAFGAGRERHVLRRAGVAARQLLFDLGPDSAEPDAEFFEDSRGDAVALAHEPKEQVFGRDVALAEFLRLLLGVEDDLARAFSKALPHLDCTSLRGRTHDRPAVHMKCFYVGLNLGVWTAHPDGPADPVRLDGPRCSVRRPGQSTCPAFGPQDI